MDLVIRTLNDDIQTLLVELFNEGNTEVRREYEEQDRKIRKRYKFNIFNSAFDAITGEKLADTTEEVFVNENLKIADTEFDNIDPEFRKLKKSRKPVEKFDVEYLISSTYITEPGEDDDSDDIATSSKKPRSALKKGKISTY
jgi:hypothetical protein